MAGIALPAPGRRKTAFRHADLFGPVPEFRFLIVGGLACRLVGNQKLHHHLLRGDGAVACGLHLHADARRPLARRRKNALALDLDHAGAAIAVGPIIRLRRITQMRNFAALTFGNLPDRFAGTGLDLPTIELERDGLRSAPLPSDRADGFAMGDGHAAIRLVLAAGCAFGVVAITLWRRFFVVAHAKTSSKTALGLLGSFLWLKLVGKIFNH